MKNVGLLVIALLFLYGTVYAERTTWYVHPDSALNTIQAGLDSCADNDMVLVGPGTYVESIIWPSTQGIHLVSELGPEETIIDGDGTNRVIEISIGIDTTSLISGFTIQNGFDTLGAGIFCGHACSPTITNNNISNNLAGDPLPLPSGDGSGAGIYCDTASSPVITNNTITNNEVRGRFVSGGGIFCNMSAPIINGNTITDNSAIGFIEGYGGGITCYRSDPIITGNTITLNTCAGGGWAWGGGIHCAVQSSAIITDNIISFNNDGLACDNASPTINNCTFEQNSNEGIICGGSEARPVIQYCDISGNGWCGVNSHGGEPEIRNCNIYDNTYGVYCWSDGQAEIRDCNIVDNLNYGVYNSGGNVIVDADSNWWGDATGPYHPTANPGGLGNAVSYYVDFDPWLSWPVGVEERPIVKPVETNNNLSATIFRGPLQLLEGKECKVFDITGRVIMPEMMRPGIYFIGIDDHIIQKVIKVR